ncbi:hypothetical protein JVX96_29785 (plasmid) [Variovorax sp. PDNC026]|uniref:tetratricopeptide repeat protein n=1 Tax=Variovorax sp. PDNC026 TaxID=2811425 RepID=UPI001962749C|nr:hypothetical protein [Variovorax sp. PDNC026]QRY35499.1 hypothetical protein JVX96_29785 [Variovorax sp. PDNC026]
MTDSHAPSLSAARLRLERLEGFLREDPSNNALLIDAFETALACGEWDRAHACLQRGQTLGADPLAWRLREGDYWLAQQRYDESLEVLESLANTPSPPSGFTDVLVHNLAFVEFRRGRFDTCIHRLEPTLESTRKTEHGTYANAGQQPRTAIRALQQLWLRALHHDGQIERAMAWARRAEQEDALDVQAGGIASLIAVDASDFAAAQKWSTASLNDGSPLDHPVESLVAQASIALAAHDAAQAVKFTNAALQRQPGDGRAWSARGFAALLANDVAGAHSAFVKAVAAMPKHIGTWHGLGWTQILQGDLDAALGSFKAALEFDRNFAESQGGLAVVLTLQSQRQAAQEHAELALRLDKANLSGRYAQALLSGEVNDAKDVQRFARRLLAGRTGPLGGDMGDLFRAPDAEAASSRTGQSS